MPDRASLGGRGEAKCIFEADLKSKPGMTESERVSTREARREHRVKSLAITLPAVRLSVCSKDSWPTHRYASATVHTACS